MTPTPINVTIRPVRAALETTVPLQDLGEIDAAWTGIRSSVYEETAVARYIHEQFLEGADRYLEKYQSTAYWRGLLEKAQGLFSFERGAGLEILDLGSGGGNTVFPLLELYPQARVTASDLSLPLLKALREHLRERYPQRACDLLQMNAEEIVFADRQFDLVVGGAILHHLFAPEKTIAEAYRVLKPGGAAIFFEPFERGHQIVALTLRYLIEKTNGRRLPRKRLLPGRLRKALLPLRRLLEAHREIPPEVVHFLEERYWEVQLRQGTDKSSSVFRRLDDKWLFTRQFFDDCARTSGFREVAIFPLHESPTPVFDHIRAWLRIGLGQDESVLPAWAIEAIRETDDHFSPEARRELLIEGGIVLEKGP